MNALRGCLLVMLMAVLLAPGPAWSLAPVDPLDDPELEQRARDLSRELRCLVCQNEPIHESSAPLAHDMRKLVRERIAAGDSDEEVKAYLVARYSDYVLLRPPMKRETYLLWYGPAAIAVIGAIGVAIYFRRRARAAGTGEALSASEQRRLERILDEHDGRS